MPSPNPAPNTANASYSYAFITGNQPVSQTTTSNIVNVTVGTVDVSATKAADKKSYLPGETVTYTITVANKGTFPVKAPVVADTPPPQISSPQYAVVSPAGATGPWSGSITLPDIPAGGTATIKIMGAVAARSVGALPNAATVTPSGGSPTTGKTSDDPINGDPRIIDTADVSTKKAADKKSYLPGESITYTITVANNGPAAAKAPVITDTLPPQIENASFSVDGGAQAPWTGAATLPDLPNGKTAVIKITGKVRAGATGTLPNSATTTTPTLNKDGKENTTTGKTVDDPINGDPIILDRADVSTKKAADKKRYLPGEAITYTITVTNNGPATAKAPKITDTPPPQIENLQFSVDGGAQAPWTGATTLPDMPSGKVSAIRITGSVKAGATGTLPNSATAATTTPNKDGNDNTTTGKTFDDPINGDPYVIDTAVVTLIKTSDKPLYLPGENITYTIKATNNGPGKVDTYNVWDDVPPIITNPKFRTDKTAAWDRAGDWKGNAAASGLNLSGLDVGKTFELEINGKLASTATGSLKNSTAFTSGTFTPEGKQINVTADTTAQVIDTADVVTKKSADKKSYLPGEAITYTITVTNNGPAAAKAPKITDTPPPQVENPQFSVDGGPSAPWTGAAALPDLPSGKSAIIKITGRVRARAMGVLPNSATTTTPTLNKSGKDNTTIGRTVDDPINGDPIVIDTADISTTKSADKKSYLPGEAIAYTITVANNGPATAKTPRITDTPPAQVENPMFSVDGGASFPWTGSTLLPDMPSGKTTVIRITGKVKARATGSLPNSATTTTTTPNKDGRDNTTTGKTVDDPINGDPIVIDTADVSTRKSADKKSYLPGEAITYTIDVINNGPAAAKAPTVTDMLHPQIDNPLFAVDGGPYAPWTGAATLPDIPSGKTAAVRITGKVRARATGLLPNSATTTTPTLNKDGGSNTTTGKTIDDPINGDPIVIDTADVTTKKSAEKKSYLPGETIAYTVTVINNGPSAAKAPKITDALPPQVENPMFSVDGGAPAPWAGAATLPDIPNGKTSAIRITGRIKARATGSLPNSATTTTPTLDKDGKDNTTTGKTVDDPINGDPFVIDTADVTTIKSADKRSYLPGEAIVYTITITNNGPATAKAPRVTDTLPPQVENPMFSVDGGAQAPWTGTAALPDMPSGKVTEIKLTGKVKARAMGSLPNSATITTPTLNKDGKDNVTTGKTVDDPINGDPIVIDTADVSTKKAADKKVYLPNEVITYTITVTNNGPATAKAPRVTDTPPPQIANLQFSVDGGPSAPWTGAITLPDLPNGKAAVIKITGKIKPGASGLLPNSATTTTPTLNKDGKENVTTGKTVDDPINGDPRVGDNADIVTTKTADKLSYLPGETVAYTITVTNNGPYAAKTPNISDAVPEQIDAPMFSVDGGAQAPWTGAATLADLPSGGVAVIKITGKVKEGASGSLANTATTTTPTPNKDGGINITTGKTPADVVDSAHLTTLKEPGKKSYLPGETVTYTITVYNSGPSAAATPTVTDRVPANVLNPQFSIDGGASWRPWTGTTTLASIPASTSAKILLRGTVAPRATGILPNSATATTPTPNSRPGRGLEPGTGNTIDSPPGDPNVIDTADVSTKKSADKKRYLPGEAITYTITVANGGPSTARTPRVTDTLSAQIENPMFSVDGGPSSPWTGATTLADMPNGKAAVIKLTGKVKIGAMGSLPNSATTTTPTLNKDGKDNVTTGKTVDDPINGDPIVIDTADIKTTKAADKKRYLPKEIITYTITVANNGPAAARTPSITDMPPAKVENLEFSVNGGPYAPWRGTATLPDIPAGKAAVIKLTGKVIATATGSLPNSATATTPTLNKLGKENVTTGRTADDPVNGDPIVIDTADVSVTKCADKTSAKPCDAITYTVVVSNGGPAAAKTPTLTDTLPPSIDNPMFSLDNGATWQVWSGSATLPDIAVNARAVVLIRGRVGRNATGCIINAAILATPTPRPDGNVSPLTASAPPIPIVCARR